MSSADANAGQGQAKYRQVYESLHDAISTGQYEVGKRLPPERELSKMLDVSPVTLRKALGLLIQDGMISRVQGNGTFVLSSEPTTEKPAAVTASSRSIAWVLIETPSEHWVDYMGYNQTEARGLDKQLSRHGYTLTMIHTDSREFASGRLPLALERGNVEGVILSGFVEDFHILYLQSRGFPVVVIGNRPVHMPVSRVQIDTEKSCYLVTKALIEAVDGPVLFVTRPFDVYYSFEVLAGYTRAMAEANRCSQVHVLTYTGNDEQEFRQVLSKETGSFALLINHNLTHEVRSTYHEFGWGFEDHPVAMVGEVQFLSQDIIRQLNVFAGDIELSTAVAAELMLEALHGGSPRKVFLDPEVTCTTEDGTLRVQITFQPVTVEDEPTEDSKIDGCSPLSQLLTRS